MKTIIFENKSLSKGFTQIPNKILLCPQISAQAKALYSVLLSFAWFENQCFPGQERLGEALGWSSDDTVRKYLDELRELKLIDWEQRGLNKTNTYIIKNWDTLPGLNPKSLGVKNPKDVGFKNPKSLGTNNTKDKNTKFNNYGESYNNEEKENSSLQGSGSSNSNSAQSEEYQEWVEQKRLNETKKKLKKKHGGSIPPWVNPEEHVDEMATSAPVAVEITDEYRQLIADLNKDGRAFIPDVDGQRLFNRFKEEGWSTPKIKAACRLAYKSDNWWKDNFTPVLFFRRTSSQSGKAINNVEKFFNMRVEGRPNLIKIKQEAKKEEEENAKS